MVPKVLLLVVMIILSCAPPPGGQSKEVGGEEDTEVHVSADSAFIIANPLNVSQIQGISAFRSCMGHDYSGRNSAGEEETLRSMKHYIVPLPGVSPVIFAPFDGEIREVHDSPPGVQVYISADSEPNWNFIFFHVDLLPGMESGIKVKSGQLLGQVSEQIQENFDMGLKKFAFVEQLFDSPFLHMSKELLAEYAAQDITRENIILSKEFRDAHPCPISKVEKGEAFFGQTPEGELVVLKNARRGKELPAAEGYAEADGNNPEREQREDLHPASEQEIPRFLNPGGTVIYQQEGLTFEHYFPYTGSLKGDESEILVYNQGTTPIQITSSDMKFIVAGRTYEQYSGTWEKFPAVQSWERIEYINIKPPYYQGQPLILEPGQKGKLHWHYQFEGDIRGKEQAVDIEIVFTSGGMSKTIEKRISREGE